VLSSLLKSRSREFPPCPATRYRYKALTLQERGQDPTNPRYQDIPRLSQRLQSTSPTRIDTAFLSTLLRPIGSIPQFLHSDISQSCCAKSSLHSSSCRKHWYTFHYICCSADRRCPPRRYVLRIRPIQFTSNMKYNP
jgi:hypothetical protein